MRRILAAFAAATFLTTSAQAIVTRHDVDDSAYRATETDYPALASMYTTRAGHRDCIATLIAPQWLITAKHCTEGDTIDRQVAAGAFSVTFATGRAAAISAIVRMPDEEGHPLATDVALLRLSSPVADIDPVQLYDGGCERDSVVRFPGWGGTGNGETGLGEEDGLFRVAENRVEAISGNFLIFRFDDPRGDGDRALPLEGISGPGDSGGPALLSTPHGWQIAGVSSWQQTRGGEVGHYGVDEHYVRIVAVRHWIDSVIAPG